MNALIEIGPNMLQAILLVVQALILWFQSRTRTQLKTQAVTLADGMVAVDKAREELALYLPPSAPTATGPF